MFPGTCKYLIICVLIALQFETNECYRSRPSPSRPSPHRPFPRPSPTHRPYTSRPYTSRPYTPAHTSRPYYTPAHTSRPYYTPAPTSRPYYTPAHTSRPYYTPAHTPSPHYTHAPTSRPYYTHAPTHRPFPTHRPTFGPTRYPTQATRYPIGPHPTYPGYGQGGNVFNQRQHYQPTYHVPLRVPSATGSKIKVYNIHNYHSPNYYAPPSYPIYHYSPRDTGSTALGFYLGYSFGRITHPTYYHHQHSFYDGYSPRYDHYTVHHYYHNREGVPTQQTVNTKVIISCGDSSQICPANTTSLCTASGQIMCVVVASNTVPCRDNPNVRCVQSVVPCENNDAPECKGVQKGQKAAINIPCISNTLIEGNITTVNNTIISADKRKNSTSSLIQSDVGVTTLPITTLPTVGGLQANNTFPSMGVRTKRQNPPSYCVTILAQPSIRQPTEGEQVFNEITNVFDKFFTKAFGMDKVQKT